VKHLMTGVLVLLSTQTFAANKPCNGQAGKAHLNGGGFVAKTAKVATTVRLDAQSEVCDRVEIQRSGWIENSRLSGDGIVAIETPIRNSTLAGHFLLIGNLTESPVIDGATIYGPDKVQDKESRAEWIRISGRVEVHGAVVGSNIGLHNNTTVDQGVRLTGNNLNLENSTLAKLNNEAPATTEQPKALKQPRLAGTTAD
jgi:hypothetical protein